MQIFKILIITCVALTGLKCASNEVSDTSMASENGVISEQKAEEKAETKPQTNGILEEEPETAPVTPTESPLHAKLMEHLKSLGYEGMGLELESNEMLSFLLALFSSPATANRKIKRVYTGQSLEYDPKAEAITIGGTTDKTKVLNFIKKKVPSTKAPQKTNKTR